MRPVACLVCFLALAALTGNVVGQEMGSAGVRSPHHRAFADAARSGSARFHDRRLAVAEGYRLIGTDFPGMGEHWINVALLFRHVLDPASPHILSYVTINGHPRLVGVGYAVVVARDSNPPNFPNEINAWHEHSSTIAAESFGHSPTEARPSPATRLAVMHAWVWHPNPDGMFARDNWSLPYLRLGLDRPEGSPTDAARALAVLADRGAFYHRQLRMTVGDGGTRAPEEWVEDLRRRTAAILHAGYPATERDARLSSLWRRWCVQSELGCAPQ